MTISNNSPAFPNSQTVTDREFISGLDVGEGGMTLRDYFAAKAMGGFASDPNYGGTCEEMAEWSYKWADAMLEQRKKT